MVQAGRNLWVTSCVALGLAVSAQASAQSASSVKFYGVIDAGVETINGVAAGTEKQSVVRVTGSNQQASRWGVLGSEDLGGGVKALFQLEGGFTPDTGAMLQNGRLFGRAALVGLSGSWGQLTIGRQKNAIFDVHLPHIPMGYTSYGVVATDGAFFTQRADNSVKYTVKRGGLSSTLMYSFGRDGTAGTPAGSQSEVAGNSKIGRQIGANANYVAGPLSVAVAYDQQQGTTPALASASDQRIYLAAKYMVAKTTLYAGMMRRNNDLPVVDTVNDLTFVGVRHPVTDKIGIAGWIAHTALKNSADKGNLVGASLFYDFSKRTQAYLNVGYAMNSGASRQGVTGSTFALPGENQSGAVVGVAHSF